MKAYKGVNETVIEDYLMTRIEVLGGICIKGNPQNNRGMPDRICIMSQGLVIFVECKRPGRKPRANQKYYLKKLQARGHHALYISTHSGVDALYNWIVNYQKKFKTIKRSHECKEPFCSTRWV